MATKKISDSRLASLWSRAVIAKYKRCPITGAVDGLQAHHVIPKGRQRRFALRWDIRNGCPLSADAHRRLHDGDLSVIRKVIDYIERRGDLEYLQALKYKLKPDYLREIGLTEDEYRANIKKELEEAISEHN